MDNHTKEVRSMNMSRIKSKDTKPEETVRKFLFACGLRYRKNVKQLPGCPDIVFPRFKTVIFVNGCFWHHHDCKSFVWPASNQEYWHNKIIGNENRDRENKKKLEDSGWRVLIFWECQLKKNVAEENLRKLYSMVHCGFRDPLCARLSPVTLQGFATGILSAPANPLSAWKTSCHRLRPLRRLQAANQVSWLKAHPRSVL